MTILIADSFSEAGRAALEQAGHAVVFEPGLKGGALTSTLAEHEPDILIVRSTKVTEEDLDASPDLELIVRAGAGYDTIDVEGASRRGIFVANCPGKNAAAVAELAFGLMLSLDRRIPDNVSEAREGRWYKGVFTKAAGVKGRTLGLIGMGNIGREMAIRARAFGMHVIAWSRSLTDEAAAEMGVRREASPIDVARESDVISVHVAATPETVKKFLAVGASITIEAGAGAGSAISDADYKDAGAAIAKTARDTLKNAALVLGVRRPEKLTGFPKGAAVVALMDPYGNEVALAGLAKAGLSALSLELIPRITRAQAMDVLSSQANLAGYQAVIEAAARYGRAMPMMMTAAGTVPAARVFVMGAGVAGLQAIATARRLGAVVTATDVRPAAREQVESLAAKFVAVEDEEFRQAETAGGYAKEMSKAYQAKQAELVRTHIAKQDIVITTALIPGRPAPRLIDKAMVKSMRAGSVIVDLAVERGGNVEGAKADEIVDTGGVAIIGYQNMAGRIAASASALLARNIFAFVAPMVEKKKALLIDRDDEIIAATLLTHDGAIVHPALIPAGAPQPAAEPEPDTEEAGPIESGPQEAGNHD